MRIKGIYSTVFNRSSNKGKNISLSPSRFRAPTSKLSKFNTSFKSNKINKPSFEPSSNYLKLQGGSLRVLGKETQIHIS